MLEAEKRLLERLVAHGDAESFAAIMSQYAGMVHGTCRRILGDEAQAADATQETFFQLLKNAHHITDSLGSWLHRVATRRAVEMIRQNVSRRRREAAYATSTWLGSAHWEDVEPLVDEALVAMPEDLRELLLKHYLQGHSMTQIAADTGLSQPTISRRMKVALDQLRYHLRQKGLTVGLPALGVMLANTIQAAPTATMQSLGKITLAQAAASSATNGLWSTSLATGGAKMATLAASVALLGGALLWVAPRFTHPTHFTAASNPATPTIKTTSEAPAVPCVAKPESGNAKSATRAEDTAHPIFLDAPLSLSAGTTPVPLIPATTNGPRPSYYAPVTGRYNPARFQAYSGSSSWMSIRPYRANSSMWIAPYANNHSYWANAVYVNPILAYTSRPPSAPAFASRAYFSTGGRRQQAGVFIGNPANIPCGMSGGGSASFSMNSEGLITSRSSHWFSFE